MKDIVKTVTLLGVVKIISGHLLKEYTPPELFIARKFVMLTGSLIASVASARNPLIINGIVSAARSIIRD